MPSRNPLIVPKISTKKAKWSVINLNIPVVATIGDPDKYIWCIAEQITGRTSSLPQKVLDGVAWGFRLQINKPGYWKNKLIIGEKLFSAAQRIVIRDNKLQTEKDLATLALCLFYLSETQWYLFDSGGVVAFLYRDGQLTRISSLVAGNTKRKLAVIGLAKLTMVPEAIYGPLKKGDIFVFQSVSLARAVELQELELLLQRIRGNNTQFESEHKAFVCKYIKNAKERKTHYSMIVSIS